LVRNLYGGLPALWASIHIAGRFALAPLTDTSGELLRRLIDDNLVSCFLRCREAVAAMRPGKAGGRIVNVPALQALEPRSGTNLSAATAAKAGVAALCAALGRNWRGRGSW
jgi:NAD(P)-dependent dehydrogenase (short-subunit alcohol dehydrogenase family)